METKDYQKLLEDFFKRKRSEEKYTYERKEHPNEWGDWIETKEVVEIPISIRDVMNKFTPEELIEAIGMEKVETILRAHKIKKLKKEIKK